MKPVEIPFLLPHAKPTKIPVLFSVLTLGWVQRAGEVGPEGLKCFPVTQCELPWGLPALQGFVHLYECKNADLSCN